MKRIIMTITPFILSIVYSYAGFYTVNSGTGFYQKDPRMGFYLTGANKTVDLIEEKTNTELPNERSKIIDKIKSMSAMELRDAYKNLKESLAVNPTSIEDAENYLLYTAEIAHRRLAAEETLKEAYNKIKEESGYIDPARFKDLEEIKRNVRLGFFLSYSEAGRSELSRFAEELIGYFSYNGFKIFVIVPSFSEKTDIRDEVLNKVSDIIIDNDGRIASEFGIGKWPACVGFVIKDGSVLNLYEGKDYADKIESSLMKLYKIYVTGSLAFRKVNFTR